MVMTAYPFFNTSRPYNKIEAAFYGSFIHLGYALAIGFHFLIFSFGQLGKFVILSWHIFLFNFNFFFISFRWI